MGVLDKYARGNDEKKNKKIQVMLTEEEYNLYRKYLKARKLTASEGTRYLILEEIGMYGDKSKKEYQYNIDGVSPNHSNTIDEVEKYVIDEKKPTGSVKKRPKKGNTSSKFSYNPWKFPVNSREGCDVFCVHCEKWAQAKSFKTRHVNVHKYVDKNGEEKHYKDTKDYIKRNLVQIDGEYERVTGKKPDYEKEIFED